MKITDGITLIEGAGANSNCYLVECANGTNVLVDAGMEDNFWNNVIAEMLVI